MSKRAAIQVFEIPELSILIIGQLRNSDLTACALVHSAWHDAVIPFLYHTAAIRVHDGVRSPEKEKAYRDGFLKYSRHIRFLEIESSATPDFPPFCFNCTNLTDLRLETSKKAIENAKLSRDLLSVISNNPGISTLYLTSNSDYRVSELDHLLVVLGLLRYMPGLKKLVMIGTCMGQSSLDEIMRCAHRLEELDLTMNRIDEKPTFRPRPSRSPIDFDLASYLADLCLKDHDDDAIETSDGPYILDTQGRRCRQGTSLKRFSLTLKNGRKRGVRLADASPLVRLCCSAEEIQLSISDVMEGPTRRNSILTLYEQVHHPAWRLKHLDIGSTYLEDYSILIKIVRDSASSLVSFRLGDSYFTDELLHVLLQNHGKTLKRMAVGKCPEFFFKANIEAILSRCPNLQSLDLYNCEKGGDLRTATAGEPKTQWVGPKGQIFKVFMASIGRWTFVDIGGTLKPEYILLDTETAIQNDPWKHIELMRDRKYNSHIRFVAN
ncbi:hypothetical protein BGZ72_010874 [Mortierella alpina]|nr:hypothetical protein BGZ72_010874 [Mortierella alpina]